MTLVTKLQVATWKEEGKTGAWIGANLPDDYSRTAIKNAYRLRADLRIRLQAGAAGSSVTARASNFPEVDSCLMDWVLAVRARKRKRMPLSLSVLRANALQIADFLNIPAFSASNGVLQNWARRHDFVNMALHGVRASATVEKAAERMREIREQLAGVDPDLIYHSDETGLLYRCLPCRSYLPREDRRVARGSQAMRIKDRVPLTLC